MNSNRKIVFIWIWMVGASWLYSCIQRWLADSYVIIDIFDDFAHGQKLDLEDSIIALWSDATINVGDYSHCSDADILVISAWRPQKSWETRLNMVQDNANIMKDIAKKVKASWFNWISLIVSNPVDIMTMVYQNTTEFDKNKVISSGCALDTARLRCELLQRWMGNIQDAFMIWEHWDSSVWTFWKSTITAEQRIEIEKIVHEKAYIIIDKKKATYFGIWSIISDICLSVFSDSKKCFSIGKYLEWEYWVDSVYASIPCYIWKDWILSINTSVSFTDTEIQQFQDSCNILRQEYQKITF